MRAIMIRRKVLRKRVGLSDPLVREWYFHGNILFRKGFIRKWYSAWNGSCCHILGFRFTSWIGQKPYDMEWHKKKRRLK